MITSLDSSVLWAIVNREPGHESWLQALLIAAADSISDSVGLWTGQGQVALVAHSRPPKDIRTAALARLSLFEAFERQDH